MSIFSINKILLAGNATRNAELKYTKGGTAVANFGLATNRSIKDPEKEGEYKDVPTFHNVVVWGKLAEVVSKGVHKGKLIMVEGRQENRSYENEQGEKRYVSEVVADKVIFPRSKTSEEGVDTEEPPVEDQVDNVPAKEDDDDIPF